VRFKVFSEEWHDQTPTGPLDLSEQPASQLLAPYTITGSFKGAGLGCYLWWEE
jgi:DNA-directed RNA polymerase III subunit RPC8